MAGTRSCSISRLSPIAEAALRRRGLDAEAYRVFHGDAEGTPGVAIDRFADVAVLHAETSWLLEQWASVARRELGWCTTAYGKVHTRTTSAGLAGAAPL